MIVVEKIDICKRCPKHCCHQPSMTKQEYAIICRILGKEVPKKFLNNNWVRLTQKDCPAFNPNIGCIIPHELKPLVCKLYPFDIIRYGDNKWRMSLDVEGCPLWKEWGEIYPEIKAYFLVLKEKANQELKKGRNPWLDISG